MYLPVRLIPMLPAFLLFSCSGTEERNKQNDFLKDTSRVNQRDTNTIIKTNALPEVAVANDLVLFGNSEIVEYCVLLPLKEFKENFEDQSIEKAEHRFILKSQPLAYNFIKLKGYIIDKENEYDPALFYKRDLLETQESGLGIDTSYIDTIKHYYYIRGYLPNYSNKKFVQITWVKEDKVNLEIGYMDTESEKWKSRIAAIINYGDTCKP